MDDSNIFNIDETLDTSNMQQEDVHNSEDASKTTQLAFNWSEQINKVHKKHFLGKKTMSIKPPTTPRGFTDLFMTEKFFKYFVKRVNERINRKRQTVSDGFKEKCKEVRVDEIKNYIGIIILMGIVRLPEITDYWSMDPKICVMPLPKKLLSYLRFTEINNNLSLVKIKSEQKPNRDVKNDTEKLFDYLNIKFKAIYKPGEHLSVDEGLIKYHGRYSFKVYMPNKPDKVGIKLYFLCDSSNAYVCSLEMFSGAKRRVVEVVKSLVSEYHNLNHKLYMDNFYTSLQLFDSLKEKGIYSSGTMRAFRGEPEIFRTLKKTIPKNKIFIQQQKDTTCFLWHDKKPVVFLNNFLNIDEHLTEQNIFTKQKPTIIKDYDKYMGGVDVYDKMVKTYFAGRKTVKWTNKFSTYIINLILHNSYVLYNEFYNGETKAKSSYWFRRQLLDEMFNIEMSIENPEECDNNNMLNHMPNKSNNRYSCVWCYRIKGKRLKTSYCCTLCLTRKNSPSFLHPECFKPFHSFEGDSSSCSEDPYLFSEEN
ncbi:PiggyBac transposable element-derived protein 4 [Cucumispora dikerogammari]|nr:PiggyBac transposable element-derived protein 4 [Cucumispora dikerogammari]